jgi:hypothetical protein
MTAAAFRPRTTAGQYREYLRERRCGNKNQYTAKFVAENAATVLGWVHPKYRSLEAYACPFCGYYHLGTPWSRKAQRNKHGEKSVGTR